MASMFERTREQRVAERLKKCFHFTGVQNKTCKAGVSYDSFPGAIPCIGLDPAKVRGILPVCELFQAYTPEQSEAREVEIEAATARSAIAIPAAHKDAKAKGYGKGHGGCDSLKCPICPDGTLRYSVAGYNGHMHARCTTAGCMSWME